MILREIAERLSQVRTIRELLEGRIYWGREPRDEPRPVLLVNHLANNPEDLLSGLPEDDQATVQIDLYADDTHAAYELLTELGRQVRLELEGRRVWVDKIYFQAATLRSDRSTEERAPNGAGWVRRRSMDFTVYASNGVR